MHPKVRDLYKRLIFVGRDYPLGLSWVRKKYKPWILQNKNMTDEIEILKEVNNGRYWIRELEGTIQLKKLRTLKRTYSDNKNSA